MLDKIEIASRYFEYSELKDSQTFTSNILLLIHLKARGGKSPFKDFILVKKNDVENRKFLTNIEKKLEFIASPTIASFYCPGFSASSLVIVLAQLLHIDMTCNF